MKFPGTCIVCNENIPVNEIGLWAKGLGVKHEKCIQANERNIPDGTVLPKNFTLEDTGVFKIINDSKIIKEQQSKIENYFKKSSSKSGKIRLTNKGTKGYHSSPYFPEPNAYFNSEYNFWWTDGVDSEYKQFVHKTHEEFENPKTFKNILGVEEPNWNFNKNNSYPILEINFNKDGTHSTAGYILEKDGNYFLGITKNIGGYYKTTTDGLYSHNGKITKYFSEHNTPILNSPKPIFLIAEIDQTFVEKVSKFLKNIKKIKDILKEYDPKDLEQIPTTVLSTYNFDAQYEENCISDIAELEKSNYTKIQIEDQIKKIESESEPIPEKQESSTAGFVRKSKLSNLLKIKFNHTCQLCEKITFKTKDGHNYTESHHILPLSMGGKDKSQNILIVCANCHRKFDSANEETLIESYKNLQKKNILTISMLKELKTANTISENMYKKLI